MINGLMEKRVRQSLTELFGRCVSKREIVTLFLALLECSRLHTIRIRQAGNFDDILIVHPSEQEDEED